jgi:hypothetical protein
MIGREGRLWVEDRPDDDDARQEAIREEVRRALDARLDTPTRP